MNTFKPCNFQDCPAHPDYKEEVEEPKGPIAANLNVHFDWSTSDSSDKDMIIKSSATAPTVTAATDNITWTDNSYSIPYTKIKSTIVFEVNDINISIECLMCKNFELKDMRREIIAYRAKKKLEEK